MPLDVIIGAQWGDEGKGRITDLLAAEADIVARYSGGDNAGHTITVGEQIFKLHLIPSGIVHPHTTCLLGSGMVVNPTILLGEIDHLGSLGVDVSPNRLKLSSAAHVLTPAHIALDAAEETRRSGDMLGTTRRGIGPAYKDKTARSGLRMEAMRQPEEFASQVQEHMQAAGELLEKIYDLDSPNPDEVAGTFCEYAKRLQPYLADVGGHVAQALEDGKTILAEGAQGTLLDLDHGTYPFVTSSYPTTPGALLGLGVGPKHLRRIIGVTKAFQTRVGSGPFPTEVFGETAERLRGKGENPWDEFGTTTGRPRRVGWLDGVLLRYAVRVNGFTELALTKLDILTGLDPLRLCLAYRDGEHRYPDLPDGPSDLSPFTPEYGELPGWHTDLWEARHWNDLPPEAQSYIGRVEELTTLKVRLISVGPERDQVIRRDIVA
ncbi:MAG: adenylosuccinate synthetase [Anaerolineae bacterium SM23_ 63]|nr:MAG: adenylosuccinate synthetase [Anaerolineae bacterium SM23_ 63]